MLVVVANLVCVGIVALFEAKYIISFEVAWVGAMCVVWSSYKAMIRNIMDLSGNSSNRNSSLGVQFRTCEKFWESTDSSLVLSQNFSQIQKPHRKILEFGDSNQGDSSDSNATDSGVSSDSNKSKNSPSLAVDTPPQTPPARGGAFSLSPSLAEGARGWVKSTLLLRGSKATNTKIYDSSKSDSNKSIPFCHTERSEVSKVRESNAMQSTITKKRIVGNSQIVKMDSSPTAQNDNVTNCFGDSHESPRNDGAVDSQDSQDSHESPQDAFATNLPKKERFFIGFRLSFGILRLLSYGFIALSIIALINNGAFHAIPFLLGIALSTLTTTVYAMKKAM